MNGLEIAVIGMAGRFPGARDLGELWRNLCAGVESIAVFSEDELAARGVSRALLERPEYVRAAGVVEGEDLFDSAFFGFTPREADILDPQHRLLLECAWEALEDAGCDPRAFRRPIGVYAGSKLSGYLLNVTSHPELVEAVGLLQTAVANDKDYLATRVSYKLDLTGPSFVVQTACSTSLAAIHLACQGLLAGECDAALAGGVSVGAAQRTGYLHTEGGILSPDGHCRPFDARAQGTVAGHGLGLVVLKRLRDALEDGDRILAVIKGSASNNDGALKIGYTAPSVDGQFRVIRAAQEIAEVDPGTVSYVEAHGTGTALGDPIEIEALTRAFRARTDRRGFCAVGSVKSNIGHLDTAAGVAGFIKTVLMLRHGKIPPSLHFEEPNPEIDFAASPFVVSSRLADWEAGSAPRRAGVSSFGIGGTNVHVVLEEAPPVEPSGPGRPWQLLVLSARTPAALETATRNLAEHLEAHPEQELADVAWTLQTGRRRLEHRRVLACRDRAEAASLLRALDPERVFTRHQEPRDRPVAFLFPGQGAQYPGMGRELYEAEPAFRREIDLCAEILEPSLGLDLRHLLFPEGGDLAEHAIRLEATAVAQPALFAVEYALARLWMEWGVRPAVLAGHSVGEYVAACLAGVFPLEDALRLVAARGRLMQSMPEGAMMAVSLPEQEILAELGEGLSLAAVNGPGTCVVSGGASAVEALRARLEARQVSCRPLHTSHAFHSAMMEPALRPFAEEVGRARLSPPRLPFFSNLTGTLIRPGEAADPAYWVRHLRATVRFGDALGELWQEPNRILLEVGPGRALRTLARQHPDCPRDGVVLSSLPPARGGGDASDHAFLLTTAGRLWMAGADPDWSALHAGERRLRVALPTYPFERRRHWVERRALRDRSASTPLESFEEPAAVAEAARVHNRPELENPYVAPRSADESAIAGAWQAVLGVDPVGVHDNFFELGGSSLMATQLAARLRSALRVDLPLRDLLEHPTVAALAGIVAERRGSGEDAASAALPTVLIPEPENAAEPFPLTEVQQAYWIGRNSAIELGNVSTHYYMEMEVTGLDLDRFQRSLRRVIERQPMLRGVVLPDGRQRILPEVPPYEIETVDLRGLGAGEAEAALLAVRERMSHQVLPSARWPLFEVAATRLDGGRTRLHLSFDFLLGDAWSLELLLAELGRFYRNPDARPAPLELSFRDYVLAEERIQQTPAYERALQYWRGRLPTLPPAPELPLARRLGELDSPRFARRHGVLERPLWERLKARAARAGLTPSGALLAAFSEVLGAWSAHPRFTLSLTLFNRLPLHPQVNALIGDFTSVILLEADTSGGDGFEARAQRLQRRLWEDLDHRYVSGVRVLRELARAQGQPGGVAVPIVFTSLLGLDASEGQGSSWSQEEGISGRQVYSISQTPQVLIDHQVGEVNGLLTFNWDVVDEAFPPGLVDEMFAAYLRLIRRLAGDEAAWERPQRELTGETQLAERAVVNATAGPLPAKTLHALFEERAAAQPDRPAVIAPDRTLTYAELDRLANRLAHRLRERGARPNRLVAVVLEKGWRQAVAVLAVVKSGAAYLPVDPALPAERLRHLLTYGEASLALTVPETDAAVDWPEGVERLPVEYEEGDGVPLEPVAGLSDLAYVIFTSGSTGLPKGVMIDHRGAANTILDVNDRFGVGPDDRVLAVSALNFDLSVYDIFGPLAAGGAVVFPEAGAVRDPARWSEQMRAERVTLWNTVPALMEMLAEHAAGRADIVPASLRLVLLSGDWIPVTLPGRIRALAPGAEVVSLGGATEASIWSILHPVEPADAERSSIPYGRPMRNQTFHVLDERLEPRPVWVPGDLYIGGTGLALGYWRDEERTRASFLVHPGTGERLYRTGDRGRYLPGGSIEFLGREDFQVKVHGHRIELGEIEAALAQHPAVEACVVAALGERTSRRLAAWIVPRPAQAMDADDLARFLRAKLPAYMVPATFTRIERVPLTANGKVDRRALPAPEAVLPEARLEPAVPRTATEEILCGLAAEVLGLDRVGADDDFFALGGHSLLATRLLSRVREAFHVELPLRQVFDAPVLARLAQAVERERRVGAGVEAPPIVPVPRGTGLPELPLSFAQQRLWFLKQLMPDSPVYNVHLAVRAAGSLDLAVLRRCFEEVVRRHEALRTRMPAVQGRPVQVIDPPPPIPLPLVDLSALPEEVRRAELRRRVDAEIQRPFSLAESPLVRTHAFRLGGLEHAIVFASHHIVWDDWSEGVLVREISALYLAFAAGRPSPLPEPPVQFADFAAWQRSWLESDVLERHLAFWRRQLDGIPPKLELPTDRPRPAEQSFRGRSRQSVLPAALGERLAAYSQSREATLFMTLLAGFQVLLHRYSGQLDLVLGTLTGNRSRPETEGMIGFFVNTLALRLDLSGDPSFEELLDRVRRMTLEALDHEDLPFERLIEALKLPRDLGYNPLTQVVFNRFSADKSTSVRLPGLVLSWQPAEPGWAPFDLALTVQGPAAELYCDMLYATDLYDASTVERLLGHYQALLEGIAEAPRTALSELPLLTAGERGQILGPWSGGAASYPRDTPVDELFFHQAERAPEAVALVFGAEETTYGELAARAGALARHLLRRGAGPGDVLALLAEPSVELVAAMIAILRVGGAYLPLDPGHPAERLAFMLEDAGAKLLLTHRGLSDAVPAPVARVDLDVVEAWSAPGAPPASLASATGLAYVIYTSGSTGRPKGVAVPHRGIARLVLGTDYVQLGPDDRVAQLSNTSFDAATFEIWGALLCGGRLIGIPREIALSPRDLGIELGARGITAMFITAALFNQVARETPGAFLGMPHLLVGGEALDPRWTREVLETAPPRRLVNGYGPTENTTFSVCHRVERVAADAWTVPIGRPIANTRAYVLDRAFQPVPAGVPGELLLGGDGLALGYLGRPALTAAAFVPDPFGGEPGARLYRTGDRVRFLADGVIEFLGRFDNQVKVRGFRIELGEIEAALAQHPAVREAVVEVRESDGHKRLVGYVVPRGGDLPQELPAELRAFLRERLPDYMVPHALVLLEALPLTFNGKLDRRALPDPEAAPAAPEQELEAPRDAVEEALAAIWRQVLGTGLVGRRDNFFALGGDSILAIQVTARAHDAGLRLTPTQLFQHQTVAELAEVARRAGSAAFASETGTAAGRAPLLPIQRWFFELGLRSPHHFNQSVLLAARTAIDPARLEAAVRRVVEHHDALRLRFERDGDAWWQVAGKSANAPVARLALGGLPAGRRREALEAACAALQASLDFTAGPLLRVAMFDLGEGEPLRLLIAVHHLAVDGVSWRILLDDLQTAYRQAAPLRGGTSFLRWAELLAGHARSAAARAELDAWVDASGSGRFTAAGLPVDFPQGEAAAGESAAVTVALGADDTRALLQEVPAAYGTQINDALLAALYSTLARWTGRRRIRIDLEGHGREELFEGVDLSRTVGWFTSLFPVDLEAADEALEPGEVLKAVKERLRAIPNRGLGFGLLRYLSGDPGVEERLRRLPQAEVAFNYLGQLDQVLPPGALFGPARESAGPSRDPRDARERRAHLLEIDGSVSGERLRLTWSFSTAVYRRETVEGLAEDLLADLRALIDHCRSPEAGGFTPSDFPAAPVTQDELDRILAQLD